MNGVIDEEFELYRFFGVFLFVFMETVGGIAWCFFVVGRRVGGGMVFFVFSVVTMS